MSKNGRLGLITPVPSNIPNGVLNNTERELRDTSLDANNAMHWFNIKGPVESQQPINLIGTDAMKLADAEIASTIAATQQIRMNRDEYLRKNNQQGFWQARQNAIDEEIKKANVSPHTDTMVRTEALKDAEAKAKATAERFTKAREEAEAKLKTETEARLRLQEEAANAAAKAQEEKIKACYIEPNHRTYKTAWKQAVFDKLNVPDEKVNWIAASNVGKTNFAKYHSGNAITIRRVKDFWWYLNNIRRDETFEGKAIIIDLAESTNMDYGLLKQIKDGFISSKKHGVRMFEPPNIWVLSNCHPYKSTFITTWTVVNDELVKA